MKIRFKKLDPKAVMPRKAHPTDAGFDLCCVTDYNIEPQERALIDTGVAMDIPLGYCGLVTGRSGNTIKRGLVGQLGIIDSDYRGTVGIMAFNMSKETISIRAGERVGQILIIPHLSADFEEAESLTETDRGVGGYGSSGR